MPMIRSFADKHTRDIFLTGKSKKFHPELTRKAVRRLEYVDLAISLSDLKVPPSNRLHALRGDRKGQYSISINNQWRICFRFENDNAYDVEMTDYH